MKIVLNKDEMVDDMFNKIEAGINTVDIYQTNLTQDDIEYLIDKYVR
jgi:hypothetical protein